MGIFAPIIKIVVTIVWPWILSNVWPILQKQIVNVSIIVIDWLVKKIKDYFSSKSEARAEQAEEKAESATRNAENSADDQEAENYRKEAAVWKQVAEQYRQDLEESKRKISEYETEAKSNIKDKIKELKPNLSSDSGTLNLSVNGSSHNLPKIQ